MPLRTALVCALACRAAAWVTISQSRYGAQLNVIRDLMHIPENNTIWHWPHARRVPDQRTRARRDSNT